MPATPLTLYLINDVEVRYSAIHSPRESGIFQQVEDIGDGRWNPTTSLIEKLAHSSGSVCPGVRRSAILDAPTWGRRKGGRGKEENEKQEEIGEEEVGSRKCRMGKEENEKQEDRGRGGEGGEVDIS